MQAYWVLSLLCFSGIWAGVIDEFDATTKPIHEKCSKISHLDQESIMKMRLGKFDDTNPAVRDHVFCYTKEVEFVSDKSELRKDVIKAKMSLQVKDMNVVEKVIKMCDLPKESDDKLWVCKVVACYYKNVPGVLIL